MTWIAPDVERSEDYPARRNEPEREMLRGWLDWHRATLLRKCAGLDATRLAMRAVPPSNLSLLGLVRHMSDTERGWVRQTYRGEPVPDLYYRSDAPDADFEEAGPAGAEEDFARYRAECRAVDAALKGAKLDDTFTFREKTMSVRWMWQHPVSVGCSTPNAVPNGRRPFKFWQPLLPNGSPRAKATSGTAAKSSRTTWCRWTTLAEG